MRVYVVERMVDGPSMKAGEVIAALHPEAEILHGSPSVGEGRFGSIQGWKDGWPTFRDTLDMVVTSRRTLALAGTVEVEDSLAAGVAVVTLHGRKLYPVTGLWYAEVECLSSGCIGRGHRQRMHADPNAVAETRHGQGVHTDGRLPTSRYRPRV